MFFAKQLAFKSLGSAS